MSIAPMNRPVSYTVTSGSAGSPAVRGSVNAAKGGVAAQHYQQPAKPAAPAPKPAAPAKPYDNPFAKPIQSNYNDMRPDWVKQGQTSGAEQDYSNQNQTWQPPQPPAMPSSPGTSPPPLEMPSVGGTPQAYDAGEGWDTSGPTDVGQGLGQRHPPASMSALADAARLY